MFGRVCCFISFLSIFFVCPVNAFAKSLFIAVIESGQKEDTQGHINEIFKSELAALLEDDYEVKFIPYTVREDAELSQINSLVSKAYKDPKSDMILVLDFAANQVVGLRASFPKPTFLPIVFNSELLGYPSAGNTTGKENLHYITEKYDFVKELEIFKSVAPFERAVLIGDSKIGESVGEAMIQDIRNQANSVGVEMRFLLHDGDYKKLVSAIPNDIDAVLMASLPRASNEDIKNLIAEINRRGIPNFSLMGEAIVRKGAFATNNPDTDWERLARRNALNMQAVLLGERAENLPVYFKSSSRLMINMETARKIRYAPRFDILSEAVLINEDDRTDGPVYSLTDVARIAVASNLSLAAQRFQSQSADQAVKEARGALLPQLNSTLSHSFRKDTNSTDSGVFAKDTTDGAIRLTQPLYSESLWANYTIQKYSSLAEEELMKQVELDIIQSAVNAYLEVLLAQTTLDQQRYNLEITRKNLNLAENRVDVGSTDASDLYRWQSELANAKSSVLSSKSRLEQARQSLNRLLNRSIDEGFSTSVETLENPDLLISNTDITDRINNQYAMDALTDFFVQRGLDISPELKQLKSQIASAKRQLQQNQRAYWVPDVNLTGQYSRNFDEDRTFGGPQAEENDWQVGVELSLPLFEGGARNARTKQSRLNIQQLKLQLEDTRNSIEASVRNAMEEAHASYNTIDLAKKSEEASQKNYDLVSESYAQGLVSIVDLLDAQRSLLSAREASMNSVHSFLIDLMNLQRAVGAFDFFLTDSEKLSFSEEIMYRLHERNNTEQKEIDINETSE